MHEPVPFTAPSTPQVDLVRLPGLQVVDKVLDSDGGARVVRLQASEDRAPYRHSSRTVGGRAPHSVPKDVDNARPGKDAAVPACERSQVGSCRLPGCGGRTPFRVATVTCGAIE